MSTKKKTTTTKNTKTKRTTQWNQYFMAAMTGLTTGLPDNGSESDMDVVEHAAMIVRRAEKIADIAEARNT